MTDGTALDWSISAQHNVAFAAGLPDRTLATCGCSGDAGGLTSTAWSDPGRPRGRG
jgi:hypothetical protein